MIETQESNFSFIAEELEDSILPMSESASFVQPQAQEQVTLSFGDGFVPIPINTVLKPACLVSQSMSFGDLYSSLVCISHKDNETSVFVSTGTGFFSSKGVYSEGVKDFRVYIPVASLVKTMALAGSHIGISDSGMSLGFWDLVVPIQNITDSDDLKKHFEQAELVRDLDYTPIDFPFGSLPSKILGLYSASLVTFQPGGVVWYSSEDKHYLNASFPFKIALHITTVQVVRSQNFKHAFLDGDKLFLKTDSFTLCVPTFSIDEGLFHTSFSVPVVGNYSPVAPVQLSTLLKASGLFSGAVRFRMLSDGKSASISAVSEDKELFTAPLLLSDSSVLFDFLVGSESLFDTTSINSVGQGFLSSSSGVCIFFKS